MDSSIASSNIPIKKEFIKYTEIPIDNILSKHYNKRLARYISSCWEDCEDFCNAKNKIRERLLKKLEQRKKQQN